MSVVQTVVPILQLIMLITGIVLWIVAIKNRKEDAPSLKAVDTYHPRNWKPIWMQKSWFTPFGFKLYLIGATLIVASGVLRLVWPRL